MRKIEKIDKEIEGIETRMTEIGPKSHISGKTPESKKLLAEYAKLEKRLVFLRDCKLYISELGNESYLEKFVRETTEKIEKTWGRAKELTMDPYKQKEYIKNSPVPSLEKKLKIVNYLLGA